MIKIILKAILIWLILLVPLWFLSSINAAQYDPMLWPQNVRDGFCAMAGAIACFVGMGIIMYHIANGAANW